MFFRVLGLTGIIKTDCSKTWYVDFHDESEWPWFVNPGVLLILYYTVAVECRHWLHRKVVYTALACLFIIFH